MMSKIKIKIKIKMSQIYSLVEIINNPRKHCQKVDDFISKCTNVVEVIK